MMRGDRYGAYEQAWIIGQLRTGLGLLCGSKRFEGIHERIVIPPYSESAIYWIEISS
jgi:hypothetical protein